MVSHLNLTQGIKLNTNCGVHNIIDGILHLWELPRLFPDPLAKRKTRFSFPMVCVSQMRSFFQLSKSSQMRRDMGKRNPICHIRFAAQFLVLGLQKHWTLFKRCNLDSGRITATISHVNQRGLDATVGARGMLMLMLNLLYTRLILPTVFFFFFPHLFYFLK